LIYLIDNKKILDENIITQSSMALRIAEVQPGDTIRERDINLLQALNKLNWRDPFNQPDSCNKLTRQEAKILKEQTGETYNGPYDSSDELPLCSEYKQEFEHEHKIVFIDNNYSKHEGARRKTNLNNAIKSPKKEIIFDKYKEPLDTGEYFSNGDRI
jgi:hypothetical protein